VGCVFGGAEMRHLGSVSTETEVSEMAQKDDSSRGNSGEDVGVGTAKQARWGDSTGERKTVPRHSRKVIVTGKTAERTGG